MNGKESNYWGHSIALHCIHVALVFNSFKPLLIRRKEAKDESDLFVESFCVDSTWTQNVEKALLNW